MEKDSLELAKLARKIAEEAEKADLDKQKAKQDQTGRDTKELAKNMGQQSSESGQPTPGQSSVAGAAGSMSQASGKLGKGDSGGANKDQQQATKQLGQAADDLGDAIAKAEQAAQEQALTKIDQMLREVLEAQRKLSEGTLEVYAERVDGKYGRLQLGKLADLSDGEGTAAEKIAKALKLVTEEGTTAVFPLVLDETKADLSNVQNLLAKKKAGQLTQSIQNEIDKNLEDMIAALRKEMRRRKQEGGKSPGGGGGGGGGKAPLIPPVAELKMLRTLQLQINNRTLTLDAQKRAGHASGIDTRLQHKIVSGREAKLAKMTETLKKKTQSSGPGGRGPGG